MIANALDSDGTFTAAQVSRKLKQLGLHVHRQKNSEATIHLRDEEFNDNSTDVAQNSDDETLLSLRQRYNYKLGHRLVNRTYIWSQKYQFGASPYPGQNSLQRVVIFGDMGKDEADGSNEYNNFQRSSLNTTKQLIQVNSASSQLLW